MGFPIQVDSGYRDAAEQQRLIDQGLPAAPVGGSYHNKGLAVDINWNGLNPDQQKALVQYMTSRGYTQGTSFGEPWHFDLRNYTPAPTAAPSGAPQAAPAPSTAPTTTPSPQPSSQTPPSDSQPMSGFDLLDQLGVKNPS